MQFLPFEIKTGKENMQIDGDLLDFAIKNKSNNAIFRLYGWEPACISLGRNQKDNFINYELLKEKKIDIVRRLTGGRALLHANEITYSFICPQNYLKHGENIIDSYKEISQIFIDKFEQIGISLTLGGEKKSMHNVDYCMLLSTGADLCYQGKKLIGSAQFRKESYILQHGSILYDYDKTLLSEIFNEGIDTSSITSINEINPKLKKTDIIKLLSSNT